MAILIEPEFNALKMELEKIQKLIGSEDEQALLSRLQEIIERLELSKQTRIKRANLKLLN